MNAAVAPTNQILVVMWRCEGQKLIRILNMGKHLGRTCMSPLVWRSSRVISLFSETKTECTLHRMKSLIKQLISQRLLQEYHDHPQNKNNDISSTLLNYEDGWINAIETIYIHAKAFTADSTLTRRRGGGQPQSIEAPCSGMHEHFYSVKHE